MDIEFNELIDFNLKKLASTPYRQNVQFFTDSTGKSFIGSFRNRIVQFMEDEGLIRFEPTKRQLFDLSEKGRKISANGGWLKYLEQQQTLHDKQAIQDEIQEKKLNNEYRLSNWQVKTFWPLFGLAILGGGYSVYDFVSNLNKDETVTKKQMESELSKIRKVFLEQNKKTQTKVIKATSVKLKTDKL